MALEAGTRLGPYEIVELLGKGGMGEVYRARDTRLDRDIAVKVLRSDLSEDESYRRRHNLLKKSTQGDSAKLKGGEYGSHGDRERRNPCRRYRNENRSELQYYNRL